MTRGRFYFLEPSKVGPQHITLIEGYLRALVSSETLSNTHDLVFCASASTFAHLSSDLQLKLTHHVVPVMDPERRRLVRKTLVEFYVVMRLLVRLRNEDILFVSCLLPTTLLMLELANRLLRRPGVHVTLHGEIEGLFDASLRNVRNFGFWAYHWMRMRRADSRLQLVVIDEFIKKRLLAEFEDKLNEEQISVVYHPTTAFVAKGGAFLSHRPDACFIGYRTRFKGFDQFEQLAQSLPDRHFVVVGGGVVTAVPGEQVATLNSNDEYMNAIAACSAAVFPYVGGYACSLSAAVLDALSAGVHVLAKPRECFVGLAAYFGPDVMTLYDTQEEAKALLGDVQWLERQKAGQSSRLQRLSASRYSIASVRQCFDKILNATTPVRSTNP